MNYDLIVLGGGPAGYVGAIRAAQLGKKVACVENDRAGGTCLNWGCIPTKALLKNAELYHTLTHRAEEFGLKIGSIEYDWSKVIGRSRGVSDKLNKGIEFLFKKNKVDYVKGWGKFKSANEIDVDVVGGGKETIRAKNVIIATGSEPCPLPGNAIPVDEKYVVTSTGGLSLEKIPKRMVVIGAGVIGLELGSVYRRLGTEVIVVGNTERICPFMDVELSNAFKKSLDKQGFKFILKSKVTGGSGGPNGCKVIIESVDGSAPIQNLECDTILVSTGRRAFTEGLQLNNVGLAVDKYGKIETNEHFQTA